MPSEKEKKQEEIEDPLEGILVKLKDNASVLQKMFKIVKLLEESGLPKIIDKIADGGIPSDMEYIFTFFTSEPIRESLIKGGNLALLLMHSLTEERTSDTVKALGSNLDFITETARSYAESSGKSGALKLYSSMKDPDVNYAIMTMMGAMKAIGRVMREFNQERKQIDSQ